MRACRGVRDLRAANVVERAPPCCGLVIRSRVWGVNALFASARVRCVRRGQRLVRDGCLTPLHSKGALPQMKMDEECVRYRPAAATVVACVLCSSLRNLADVTGEDGS